jgi:ABC-type phosphate transport system substrate-binding protein
MLAIMKKSRVASLLIAVCMGVAACNPPLSPELQAALADNSINCGSTPISVSAPAAISPAIDQWSVEYTDLCPAAGISSIVQDEATPTDIVLTSSPDAPSTCTSYLTVPVMASATVLAISLQGLDGLILDPEALSKIVNGEITSWDDPSIVALNPQFEAVSLPVKLSTTIPRPDAEAIDSWLTRIAPQTWAGWPTSFTITDQKFDENNPPQQLYEDGGLSFVPFWFASNNSLQSIQLKVDPNSDAVPSSLDYVTSGVSQITIESQSSPAVAKIDATRVPLPLEGFDKPLAPWQAIIPEYAHACEGGSEADVRSFLRFMLRSNSQASLSNYAFFGLPPEARGSVISLVSKGLPSPSPIAVDPSATP